MENTIVQCSRCRRTLRFTGSMMDDILASGGSIKGNVNLAGYKQWLGSVCTNCNMVFCEECQDCGWASPCRNCGQSIKPALASYLPIEPQILALDVPPFSPESLPKRYQESQPQPSANKGAKKKWWEFWK